ncbi:hypothetical protein BDV26DRAFT_261419 [Aspergillus bertholletiae]|uniref:Uncharacterized protein n=1 Tax=Aspergillus bertholletiae TaxID=1226010 RepID=A0A5N7BA21_9EURO|nr:hypothetical protein BDV26DRAFT_261419 [Aspergillus bertholletiae]
MHGESLQGLGSAWRDWNFRGMKCGKNGNCDIMRTPILITITISIISIYYYSCGVVTTIIVSRAPQVVR